MAALARGASHSDAASSEECAQNRYEDVGEDAEVPQPWPYHPLLSARNPAMPIHTATGITSAHHRPMMQPNAPHARAIRASPYA